MDEDSVDRVKRGSKMIADGFALMGCGPFNWYLDELVAANEFMMERCCPYQVGARVQLVKAPDVSAPGHGWKSCAHFLIPGAFATVRERSCGKGGFSFHVEFDNESWIDSHGAEQLMAPDRKHTYHFGERYLMPARTP